MKYRMIQRCRTAFPIRLMCRCLRVSSSRGRREGHVSIFHGLWRILSAGQKQMILASNYMLPARTLGYILAALALLFAFLETSIASDILRIETILASPSSYAQHDVPLRGKARQIRKAEPYPCSKSYCGRSTVA